MDRLIELSAGFCGEGEISLSPLLVFVGVYHCDRYDFLPLSFPVSMPSLKASRRRLRLRSKKSKPPKKEQPKKQDVKSEGDKKESKPTDLPRVPSDDSTSSNRSRSSASSR